jgi:protocatechuate 3,4-dioxygenase, beta subunit
MGGVENDMTVLRAPAPAGTLNMQRRSLLAGSSGLAVPSLLLAPGLLVSPHTFANTSPVLLPTPAQSEGPFYPQGSFFAARNDVDADLLTVAGSTATPRGTPLVLSGRVLTQARVPVAGAAVEIWQCDFNGQYAYDISTLHKADKGFQGFGRTLTDAQGRYSFRTLKPVAYYGRPPHIHVKVWQGSGAARKELLTTQMYVRGEVYANDFVFRAARDEAARALLIADLKSKGSELVAQWDVVVG